MKIRLSEKKTRVRFSTLDKSELMLNGSCHLDLHPYFRLDFLCEDDVTDFLEVIEDRTIAHLNKSLFEEFLSNEVERYSFRFNDIAVDIEKDYPCSHQEVKNEFTFSRPL